MRNKKLWDYNIYWACRMGKTEKVREFLEQGVKVDYLSLVICIKKQHPELVRLLIEAGAEVNAPSPYGWTPLHYATEGGNLEIFKLIIDAGAKTEDQGNRNLQSMMQKYYFEKAHEHIDDFGLRIQYLLLAKEYNVVSRLVAEKCGLPFGEKPEIKCTADVINFYLGL